MSRSTERRSILPTRTYIPMLIDLVHHLCVYTTRWNQQIRENIPDADVRAAFDALTAACSAFLALIGQKPTAP